MRLDEHRFQNAILVACSKLSRCRVWRNTVGTFRAYSKPEKIVKVGLPGQADIFGIIDGRFLSIEVKARSGRVRKEQTAWAETVEAMGGLHILARLGDDLDQSVRGVVEEVTSQMGWAPPAN